MVLGAWTRLRKKYVLHQNSQWLHCVRWMKHPSVHIYWVTFLCKNECAGFPKDSKVLPFTGKWFHPEEQYCRSKRSVNKRGKRYHSDLKTDSCKWYTPSDKLSSVSHNGMMWIGVFQELKWWREKMVLAYKSDEINRSKSSKCWSLKILVGV